MTKPLVKVPGEVKAIRDWNGEVIIVVELKNGETVLGKERHTEALIKPGDKVVGDLIGHMYYIDEIKEEIPQITLKTAFVAMMLAARTEGIEVDQKYYDLEIEITSSLDIDIYDMVDNLENMSEAIKRVDWL
jgi:hypothetical protein